MVTINQTKTISCLLVVPSPSTPPAPLNEQTNDDSENRKRKDKRGLAGLNCNCNCTSLLLGGLGLIALLAVSITIPLVVSLSTLKSKKISSSSITASTTTDIPCLSTCSSQQTCVKGVCLGIGYLSCTLTWSRNGDGDIAVTTPNNLTINYTNKGPSASTDQGQLDHDDKVGTGPENVFWSNSSSIPPSGVYYVCFSQFNFNPIASANDPITASITVMLSSNNIITVSKTFTSVIKNVTICTSTSSNLLTSFTYP